MAAVETVSSAFGLNRTHLYFNHGSKLPVSSRQALKRRLPEGVAAVNWVLFERRIVALPQVVPETYFPAASSASTVVDDREVWMGLYLRNPPVISHVQLREEGGPPAAPPGPFSSPNVLAADVNRLLLHVPRNGVDTLLVYKVDPLLPSLDLIPPLVGDRSAVRRGTGIVSGDKNDFAIGFLDPEHVGARTVPAVTIYRSGHNWITVRPPDPSGGHTFHWTSEAAVSHHDCLCWPDYARGGILVCDVLSKEPSLAHIRLPPSTHGAANQTGEIRQLL
ncbi:hypothetical protein ACP4OV_018342 [Aristida adscensionis]